MKSQLPSSFRRPAQPVLVFSLLLLAASPVLAQPASEEAENSVLEEVIVTASYREVSVQDLSIAVSALTSELLESMGASEVQDYYRTVPNFSIVDRGPGLRVFTLRGISTGLVTQSSATVGVYLNDVPITAAGFQPDIKVFDLERIEVLRGPQGTLYGEGSMGGTLRMITPDPDPSGFYGKAEGILSDTSEGGTNWSAAAVVNAPLVEDTLALRASAYHYDRSGFIDRIAEPEGVVFDFGSLVGAPPGAFPVLDTGPIAGRKDINDEETSGGRMALLWNASDALSFELMYLEQNSEFGGRPIESNEVGDYNTDFYREEKLEDELDLTALTIKWDLDWANFNSTTSFWDRSVARDADNADLTNALFPGAKLSGVGTFTEDYQDEWTQEFRLTSNRDGKLSWLLGAFYEDKDNGFEQYMVDELGFFIDFVNMLGIPATNERQLLDQSGVFAETQLAFYGELDYQFSDRWSGTVGLRYFDYDQTTTIVNNDINIVGLGLQDGTYDGSDSGTTSKFSLRYAATDNLMIYGTIAEGYRIGGVNTAPLVPEESVVYGPDSLWSYEMGAKLTSADGRMTFNTAVYYVDWTDIQLALPLGFSFATVNAGEAESMGAEFEFAWQITERLDLMASLGLNEGELSRDVPEANNPSNPNPGFKGDTLPGVADSTASLSLQYAVPIADWGLDWFTRGDLQYTGDSQTTFNELSTANGQPSHFELDSYTLLNLRMGLRNERWDVSLFADNVTDERAEILRDNAAYALRTTINRPRTIGVRLSVDF
jgi:iron complex outermembrane receptor protein